MLKLIKNETNDDPSAIVIIDDGKVIVKLNGPMAYCAAGAFLKYHKEVGLVRFAFNFVEKN